MRAQNYYWVNLDENALRTRIGEPWDQGDVLSWSGQSAAASDIEHIEIYKTDDAVSEAEGAGDRFQQMQAGETVTNEWLEGAPGRLARVGNQGSPAQQPEEPPSRKDARRVMVVHGRNVDARNAMFAFLRCLGLSPIEWEEAVAETGMGSPYTLEAVQAAMEVAQAVVVVLTAEDQAGLLPALAERPDSPETAIEGQPRQNVMLEAGMAIGTGRASTILVEIGPIRAASDLQGLNVVRMTNDAQRRAGLRHRLINAGCAINESTQDWLSSKSGGDFDASRIDWEPQSTGALTATMAIPTTDLRGGQNAELNLRCFRLPEGTRIVCSVTPPEHEPLEAEASGVPGGEDQLLFSLVYPGDFDDAPVIAGTHAVSWTSAAANGGERRELAVSEFRFA